MLEDYLAVARCPEVPGDRGEVKPTRYPRELLHKEMEALAALEMRGRVVAVLLVLAAGLSLAPPG